MPEIKYANSINDLLGVEDTLAMSGLDYMQGIVDGKFPAPPISRTLNFRLVNVDKGKAVFRGTPEFDFCNPMGTVHGGWYGTILDSAMACSLHTLLPPSTAYTTLEYKVNITRTIPLGTEVECIGNVQHFGRTTGVANGVIVGVDNGKTYATGSTTCIVLTP